MRPEDFPQEASRLRGRLIAEATRILGDGDEAKDVVQDALLRLWQLCPALRQPVDGLALAVTRNMALSGLRRRRPAVEISEIDVDNSAEEDADGEAYGRIMRCIEALPPLQQMVFRLRHVDGMSYSEIASLTGNSEQSLRKAVSRARMSILNQYREQQKRYD